MVHPPFSFNCNMEKLTTVCHIFFRIFTFERFSPQIFFKETFLQHIRYFFLQPQRLDYPHMRAQGNNQGCIPSHPPHRRCLQGKLPLSITEISSSSKKSYIRYVWDASISSLMSVAGFSGAILGSVRLFRYRHVFGKEILIQAFRTLDAQDFEGAHGLSSPRHQARRYLWHGF